LISEHAKEATFRQDFTGLGLRPEPRLGRDIEPPPQKNHHIENTIIIARSRMKRLDLVRKSPPFRIIIGALF
jgi:hypothetical protein